jgi:hypothetical protein
MLVTAALRKQADGDSDDATSGIASLALIDTKMTADGVPPKSSPTAQPRRGKANREAGQRCGWSNRHPEGDSFLTPESCRLRHLGRKTIAVEDDKDDEDDERSSPVRAHARDALRALASAASEFREALRFRGEQDC